MRGIVYKKDGQEINIVDDDYGYSIPNELLRAKNDVLFVIFLESFGFNFEKFYQKEKLIAKIYEYEKFYGQVKKVIFIFNEIIVDPTQIHKLENEIFKKCYYATYDMEQGNDGKKLFLPLSLLSQLNYALDSGYLTAKKFLSTMTYNYHDLIKPHKAVFLSNHVSPIRIKIFNILKKTNNLKNCVWSFKKKILYYSGNAEYLEAFFKENEGIVPYSYDGFEDSKVSLKSTYFYQFESYFEICTESYFFKDVKNIENSCPVTEKMVKPILSFMPFIFFGAPRTKTNLEKIGMTFNCPLYGFYDNTSEESMLKGLKHLETMINKDIKELHEIYFQYYGEFTKNADFFINHFRDLINYYKKTIFSNQLI